jgi:hypothetical protein
MAEFSLDNIAVDINTNIGNEPSFYGNQNTQKVNSPKIVDVGIDLLANKNMKRDNSIGSIDAVAFDMPVEDLNLNDSINLNLYDMLQNNNSNSNTNSTIPATNFTFKQPSPDKTYGRNPIQTNSTLGADTATDANLNSDTMGFTLDNNINNVNLDPFDTSKLNANAEGQASFDANGEPKKDIDDLDKMDVDELLSECSTLKEKHGINTPAHFNRRTPTDEIRAFIRRERRKREKNNAEKLGAKILLTIITSLEFLNNKFDPFDLKLDGWSEGIHENIDDYNEVFGELFEKYKTSSKMPPEVKLIMMVGGSAAMVHLTNTMFKSSLPGMEDMLKQNPEMMKQFATAAQQQSHQQTQQQQQHVSQPSPVKSSGMDILGSMFSGMSKSAAQPPTPTPAMMGPMRQNMSKPVDIGTGLSPMQQPSATPRREMRGPSGAGVDDILNELVSKPVGNVNNAIHLPVKQKSPSGSLISSGGTGTSGRRTINISLGGAAQKK